MKRAGKTFSCPWLFIYPLYHWEKTRVSEITLLMINIVREISIPHICIDFQKCENRTCTGKLLLNVFQTSKNNK